MWVWGVVCFQGRLQEERGGVRWERRETWGMGACGSSQNSDLGCLEEGCCAPGALTRVAVPVPFSALLWARLRWREIFGQASESGDVRKQYCRLRTEPCNPKVFYNPFFKIYFFFFFVRLSSHEADSCVSENTRCFEVDEKLKKKLDIELFNHLIFYAVHITEHNKFLVPDCDLWMLSLKNCQSVILSAIAWTF